MARMVIYAHRPKPPLRKSKAEAPKPTPAPTIVVTTSEKQLKRLPQERALTMPHEPDPKDALFARNVRPGSPRKLDVEK